MSTKLIISVCLLLCFIAVTEAQWGYSSYYSPYGSSWLYRRRMRQWNRYYSQMYGYSPYSYGGYSSYGSYSPYSYGSYSSYSPYSSYGSYSPYSSYGSYSPYSYGGYSSYSPYSSYGGYNSYYGKK